MKMLTLMTFLFNLVNFKHFQCDESSTAVWKKRPGLHCSPASSCPAHHTSTLPHRLWPSTHHRQIDNNYSYSPRSKPPPIIATPTSVSRSQYRNAVGVARGDSAVRRDLNVGGDLVADAVAGTIIL